MKTVLIVKPDAIGDYILFRNFLKEIKKKWNCKIILLGSVSWKYLAKKIDKKYIDEFIEIEKITSSLEYINIFNKKKINLILYLTYSGKFNEIISKIKSKTNMIDLDKLISQIKSKRKIVLLRNSKNRLKGREIFSDKSREHLVLLNSVHKFDRNKEFFEKVLKKKLNTKLHLDYVKKPSKPYAVIFPGASSPLKRWSWKKFSRIAEYLHNEYNLKIVLAGSLDDRKICKKISKSIRIPSINLAGKTSLLELVNLIGNSKILITNDTCATHIGVATKTRTICMGTGIFYGRFLPYPDEYFWIKCIFPPFYFSKFHGPINLIKSSLVKKQIKSLLGEKLF